MKRGPKPCLVELPLTTWMDECADQMVCPTLTDITDEAIWQKRRRVCRTQLSLVSLVRHGGNDLSVATVTLFQDLLKMLNRSVPLPV